MVAHRKGSTHKRRYITLSSIWECRTLTSCRVKALKDEPYTQKEAEAAIGLRTDNGSRQAAKENTKDVEVEMENSGFLEDSLTT
jgi:bud site selection protein 20